MLRGLLVIVCIVSLVATMVFGPRYLTTEDEPAPAPQTSVTCDLDVETCRWGSGDERWHLELERSGTAPTDPFQLELLIPTDEAGDDRLIAVLAGQSMYMGQYPVALQRGGATDGRVRFHAEFQAPLCTVDPDMIWTITLKRGAEPVDIPLVPTFQTRHPDAR